MEDTANMSTLNSAQSIAVLFTKLIDLIMNIVEACKAWKKEQEAKKIKADAVSSFLETFNPSSNKK